MENGVRVVDVGEAEAGGIPRNVSEMSFEQKKQYNLSISGLTYKVSSAVLSRSKKNNIDCLCVEKKV